VSSITITTGQMSKTFTVNTSILRDGDEI